MSDHNSGIDHIHEYGLDKVNREIYLFGRDEYIPVLEGDEPGVEFAMANAFIKNLRVLENLSTAPILIHMKTCGGHWFEGMAIYQAIKYSACHITILNYTHARSMSSIILQAADRRVMMPYSVFMFHDGTIGQHGTVKQYFTEAEQVKIQQQQMFDIYIDAAESAFAGRSRSYIKKWMRDKMDRKEGVYLSPQQAIECGFADAIFSDWGTVHG